MCDFENPPSPDGTNFDDWELSEQEIKEIERAMQDMNDGFGYRLLTETEGEMVFKCLKCGREAAIHERPFPHKYDCPMKDRIKD